MSLTYWVIKWKQQNWHTKEWSDWYYHCSSNASNSVPVVYKTKGMAEGKAKALHKHSYENGMVKIVKWNVE